MNANNSFLFQPAPLPPVEEQKKAGAYSKHTPLKGSKASKKGEEKTSQKKLFEEDTSPPHNVTSSDLVALNSGGAGHQSCASFSGTLDTMELTCLSPATSDHQAGAVGDKKKSWADLDEEDIFNQDTFLIGQDPNTIAEERTLEEEQIIEEDVTMSFPFPSGLASSLFWPFRSLSGNNFPYFPNSFPDKSPLLLSGGMYDIPPFFIYFRQFGNITLPNFQHLILVFKYFCPQLFFSRLANPLPSISPRSND